MKKIFALGCLLIALAGSSAVLAQQVVPARATAPYLMMAHVRVADMARAERFYTQLFGMTVSYVAGPHEHILVFPGATPTAAGVILLLAKEGARSNGGFLMQVPDIDATFARVAAAGGKVERAPRLTSPSVGVRAGFISDPDGTRIEVMQYATARR